MLQGQQRTKPVDTMIMSALTECLQTAGNPGSPPPSAGNAPIPEAAGFTDNKVTMMMTALTLP